MVCRVAVVGNVDAGKSTLLGVLTHGELDNGRGFARQKLFRHKHEMESGRTSSVGNDILGFDQEGQVMLLQMYLIIYGINFPEVCKLRIDRFCFVLQTSANCRTYKLYIPF